ncbi:MAG: Na/Pi symporter, partial [Fibrobacter sp.]|nr:Na/Pi symporter [Fibrobacter sp.]
PLLIAVGFFISMRKSSETISGYGKLILSLGFIFFGMRIMAEAVMPLRDLPAFQSIMHTSLNNRWYGVAAGTLITAVIQSSAATLALLIALVENYSLNGELTTASELFPIILGANLGTCITAFISTIKAETEGVRVAWAHFLFKFVGVLLFFFITDLDIFNRLFTGSPAFQTAAIHTFFNLSISILFLPFIGLFERLILFMIPDSKKTARYHLAHLHDSAISLPVLGLSQASKEIECMGQKVTLMLKKSLSLIDKFDTDNKRVLLESDDEIDFYHSSIIDFLTKLTGEESFNETVSRSYELVMVTADLEHIGDIVSKNIVPLTEKIHDNPIPLSEAGKREILDFLGMIVDNFENVMSGFSQNNTALVKKVLNRRHEIHKIYNEMFDRHMNRLYSNKAQTLQTTSIHVDLLEDICHINHFTTRIASGCLKNLKSEAVS